MKICVAQTRPVKGNIQANIENHKKIISFALSHEADTIIFPELSLTGYEPGLSKELAIDPAMQKFAVKLKEAYDVFEKTKQLPLIAINKKGEYLIM